MSADPTGEEQCGFDVMRTVGECRVGEFAVTGEHLAGGLTGG